MDTLNLPICDISMPLKELINIEGKYTIHEILEVNTLITNNVGADCWAVTSTIIDNNLVEPTEVLFNNFKEETLSLKENIMNNIIRDKIINNPHSSLLIQLFCYKRSANIDIYMFGKTPYKIRINYDSDNKIFNISGYMSEEYKQKFNIK